MTFALHSLIGLTALAVSAVAFAQSPQGDPEAGLRKVYTCTGCHGIPGYRNAYPHYHVPKIAGQNYEYLVSALLAYRKGERQHPTMRAQAEGYSEQDLRDIAAFLSTHGAQEAK